MDQSRSSRAPRGAPVVAVREGSSRRNRGGPRGRGQGPPEGSGPGGPGSPRGRGGPSPGRGGQARGKAPQKRPMQDEQPTDEKRQPRPKPKPTNIYLDAEQARALLLRVELGVDPETLPILLCVDVEFFESNQDMILELGFCMLDLRPLAGSTPGDRLSEWTPAIRAHHLIASNNARMRNGRFCPDNRDNFLFGQSVSLDERYFAEYVENSLENLSPWEEPQPRRIMLVGHSIGNDGRILSRLGFQSWPPRGYCGTLDSQILAKELLSRRLPGGQPGLSRTLEVLGLPSAKLHNGGNDAFFTLQAALSLVALTQEQLAFLQPEPPVLSMMAKPWPGIVEPETDGTRSKSRAQLLKQARSEHFKEQRAAANAASAAASAATGSEDSSSQPASSSMSRFRSAGLTISPGLSMFNPLPNAER